MKHIKREHDPDYLFIEPSELVTTSELRDVIAMGLRDIAFHPGPLITLVDGPNFDFLWAERQRLIRDQVANADVIAVSRLDCIDTDTFEKIQTTLKPYGQDLRGMSTHNNTGIKSIWDTICASASTRPPTGKSLDSEDLQLGV